MNAPGTRQIRRPTVVGSDPAPAAPARELTRRVFLKRFGMGASAAVIVAGGGLTWRAIDQGVFAPGTGPAYEPWHLDLSSGGTMSLVGAAILAANAHDSQPWAFRVAPARIDLFAAMERSIGAMDPLGREMQLSLGCALENLVLAAKAHGYRTGVRLVPTAGDPTHVASVALAPGPSEPSDLYAAISFRHTNRAAYRTDRQVPPTLFEEIGSLADAPEVSFAWLSSDDEKARFSQLTIEATAAIIADVEQARDDFAWYRQDRADIERRRDGITMDAGGMGDIQRLLVRMLPPSSQATMQQGWLDATRDRQVSTAAAFGIIAVRDRTDQRQRLMAGRLLQRTHLYVTTKGVGLQPLNQIFERADREASSGLAPVFTGAADRLSPDGWHGVTAFRIGYPESPASLSPRRPAEDVIRT
jgi:nitroreductase